MRIIIIKSFTDPSKEYMVRVLDTGEWRCSCPSFILRRSGGGICKHIRQAQENEKIAPDKFANKNSMAFDSDVVCIPRVFAQQSGAGIL